MMDRVRIGRPGRRFAFVVVGAIALIVAALFAVGWYYASLLKNDGLEPDYSPDELNLVVVSVEGDQIILAEREGENVDDLVDDELWGLDAESGYGQVGDVLEATDGGVTRRFEILSGTFSPGDFARLDSFAYEGDPLSARGLEFRQVAIPAPLGELSAWQLDGPEDTWVVFVHGWRSDREEALRVLPTVASLGMPSLVVTYRNDEGAPRSQDGLIRFGATEWEDLEAAVDYAVGQGARSVVLYGYSTGGGIAVSYLERSERTQPVIGAILDAPLLDFEAVVDFQARRRNVLGVIVSVGKQLATWRFDVDWDDMDHLRALERLNVPVLLFHGEDDKLVPIETSRRLADKRRDLVTFISVPTAGHVRSWNVDPEAYESAVRSFLAGVAGVSAR